MNELKEYLNPETGTWFIRTRRDIALRKLAENPERSFFLVGSKVSPSQFHSGWNLATKTQTSKYVNIERYYNDFNYYLSNRFGKPIFYIELLRIEK